MLQKDGVKNPITEEMFRGSKRTGAGMGGERRRSAILHDFT